MGEFSDFALVPEQGVVPAMDQLGPQMRARIELLASKLNVKDGAAVQGFGARAQQEMGTFSDIALSRVLARDMQPLSGAIEALAQQIRTCSFASEAKDLFSRMLGKSASVKQVYSAYEKAEPRINALADEMTDRRVALMRDSATLDWIYERNEALYREICSLLVIGEEAIRQAKERNEEAQTIARLERRMEDIHVTHLASAQLAAQIRMIQASDSVTCEKLKSALEVTIPLWKSQMAAALGLARAADSMTAGRRAERQAAHGVRSAAGEIQAQRAAYGKAVQTDDRERAEQTAEALLCELEEIEESLKQRETASHA